MATADENIYDHIWSENQIVMWDNRRVMHKATNFEIMRYEGPSEEQRPLVMFYLERLNNDYLFFICIDQTLC